MIAGGVAGVTRPNFLILTPLCVFLAVASSLLEGYQIEWDMATAVILGAIFAHVSVNALNEYADYQSGLDFNTERTPFSGGSGTLVMRPHLAPYAKAIGIVSLCITITLGCYLVLHSGWGLIPIGLLGVLIIVFYTGWINKHKNLVLIAPGFAFGPLMVVGSHYALTGELSFLSFWLSLIPFFLVNNLLLLNQIPDIAADKAFGRDNYMIAWQPEKSAWIYAVFTLLAYAVLVIAVVANLLPMATLIALLPGLMAYRIFLDLRGYQGDVTAFVPSMGKNVMITLLTPALLVLGVIYDLNY